MFSATASAQTDPDIELYLRRPLTEAREKTVSRELEAAIKAKERQASAARDEAIKLLESYMAENPNSSETPEALFKLAELY